MLRAYDSEISTFYESINTVTFLRNATAYGISPKLRLDLVVNNLVGWAFIDKQIKILVLYCPCNFSRETKENNPPYYPSWDLIICLTHHKPLKNS